MKVPHDELAVILGKNVSTIRRNISKLKQFNIIKRVGTRKHGQWKCTVLKGQNDPTNALIDASKDALKDAPINTP
jgi:predicted HTH transcriptional regulator